MTKKIEDYYVPWVKGIPMYISEHIEKAWRNPALHRMMSNENPTRLHKRYWTQWLSMPRWRIVIPIRA